MKTLFLIRHAKSSWDNLNLTDFDRPLNERGNKNAPFMGKILKKENVYPDEIISSPAKRAITTARKIAEEISFPKKNIKENLKIYDASISTLIELVNKIDDKHHIVFLFGHNPGFTDFLNYLTESEIGNIPTCGIARIEFDFESWKFVSKGTGILIDFKYPKMFD